MKRENGQETGNVHTTHNSCQVLPHQLSVGCYLLLRQPTAKIWRGQEPPVCTAVRWGGGGGGPSVRSSRHISSVGVIDCTAKRYEFHREAHPAVANRQDVITHLYSSSQLPLRVCSAGGSPERNHAINSSGLNVPRFGTL
jgi:hypothetical protein